MNRTIERCARTAAFFGVLVGAMAPAYAGDPYFAGDVRTTIDSTSGAVKLCFKEVGLHKGKTVKYVASGYATATYVCRNHGGQCPNAANKSTVAGPAKAFDSESFTANKHGEISACIILRPPSADGFGCPGNQVVVLSKVTFTKLTVTDTTHHVSTSPVSKTLDRGECPAR